MRQFRSLFRVEKDQANGVMYIFGEKGTHDYPSLMISREGEYVPISVSYGPIELALRLRYADLSRNIARLRPVDGLQTTRQVGSTSAYLALGLRTDGSLLMRLIVIADARGHISFNLSLPSAARQELLDWLGIEVATQ